MTTHKSYSLFMTSFSMPSIALSNSESVAFRHTSLSRIRTEMNYYEDEPAQRSAKESITLRKSLISFTWSLTVNVRLAKLLKKLKIPATLRGEVRDKKTGRHTIGGTVPQALRLSSSSDPRTSGSQTQKTRSPSPSQMECCVHYCSR